MFRLGRLRFILTIVFAFAILLASSSPVFAQPPQPVLGPAWTPTPPTIDGVLSANEWSFADSESFSFDSVASTVYVMNDATNLYIAVTIDDNDNSEEDEMYVVFDNNNDGGSSAEGDDALVWWSSFVDAYQSPYGSYVAIGRDSDNGGSQDGNGARTQDSSNTWFYEISHPIDSSDNSHDFSLSYGSTVGFAVSWKDRNPSLPTTYHNWPSTNLFDPANYGDIIIANPRPEINSEWTNSPPSIDGIVQAGEWSNLVISFTSPEYPDSYVLPTYAYFMNDATNLYVLVDAVGDATNDVDDECLLIFDYNSSPADGYAVVRVLQTGVDPITWSKSDSSFDAAIGYSGSPQHKVYEFSIPFAFIGISPGDSFDFCSPFWKTSASMPYDPGSTPARDNVWPKILGTSESWKSSIDGWGIVNSQQQRQRAPSNPPQHVGGELFSANKLVVLSPYFAFIGIVGVAVILVKRRKI